MKKRRAVCFRTVLEIVWIGLLLSPTMAAAAETQKRVLTIYSARNDLTGNVIVDQTLRSVLTSQFKVPIDFRTEYTNNVNPLSDRAAQALREFLRAKYAGERLDIVIAVGDDAIRFVHRHGEDVFPGASIVSWGSRDLVKSWDTGPPQSGVVEPDIAGHLKGAIDFIMRVQPDVKQIFMVSGASKLDQRRQNVARHALRGYESRVILTYLTGMPLEELQQCLTNLPKRSAVFFLALTEDGEGRKLVMSEVLQKLTATANAPIYAPSAVHLGSGIVGGLLISQEQMTTDAAEIVLQILHGERAEDIPQRESVPVPMVDWRQLRRWHIDEDRLPPNTAILYKERSFWDVYKWHILGILSISILEAALIVALLIQQARRRQAEKEAARNRELLQSTIDALDAHVAVLDENANIIAVNESWRRFGTANGYSDGSCGVGKNYLQLCDSFANSDEARMVKEGINALMKGESSSFSCVYEFSRDTNECWFQLKATRFTSQGVTWLALANENITEIKLAHDIRQQHTGLLLQAQDEERKRIARDLHDVTVQNVATIKVNLTGAQGLAKTLAPPLDEAFRQSVSLCDQVINELRTLSYLLHPPLLDEAGLVPALQWYVRGFMQRSGINIEILVVEDIGRLPCEVETALFRVVQESLSNIHRHSGSRSAVIWVAKDHDEVVIRIQDDGHGIQEKPVTSPKTGQALGVGILGMRERLRQLGGRLEIESNSHGTTVTARTPLQKEGYVAYSCS